MKCHKAHKWIALQREGELDANSRKKLREHLETCEACNQAYRDYKRAGLTVARIRSQVPVSENNIVLTDRILDAVTHISRPPEKQSYTALLDRIHDITVKPAVRYVAAASVLVLLSLFLYQQAYIHSNTAALKKQLSAAERAGMASAASKDFMDCMERSERYLSEIKTVNVPFTAYLGHEINNNPDLFRQYASSVCRKRPGILENSFIREIIPVPEHITY